MKRSTRNVVIVAACAVALGTALVVLQHTGGENASSSSVSSSAEIQLISKQSSDVVSMKVTNQKGSYTIVPVTTRNLASAASGSVSSAAPSSSASTATTTYTVEELGGYPVDTSAATSVMQNGFSLSATKSIGTVSDLSTFGLGNPQATVEVKFKDGSTFGYKIGNATATNESAYYMCGDKTDSVYIVNVDAGLLEPVTYFLDKEMISVKTAASASSSDSASSGDYSFTRIALSGTAYPGGVVMEMKDGALAIVSPDEYEVDSDSLQTLETPLTSLTADGAVAYGPDAAALKKYGLDKPTAVAEYSVNKENHKLVVGAKNGSQYYVMADDKNVVYSVASDSISGLATQSPYALRSKLVFLPNIKTVKTMTVTNGSKTTRMDITRKEKASSSSAASSSGSEKDYDYAVTVGGKKLDYENFRGMYENVISIALYDDKTVKPSGKPAASLEYGYFDKSGGDVIQFYDAGDRRYTIVKNGKIFGTCTQTVLQSALQKVDDFAAGKKVDTMT